MDGAAELMTELWPERPELGKTDRITSREYQAGRPVSAGGLIGHLVRGSACLTNL